MDTWKHFRAILLLPGMVLFVIPATILFLTSTDSFALWQSLPATRMVLPILGVLLVALGLVPMVATIPLFVTAGKGTLGPWNPTQKLVVRGVYRHIRNPMISGVMFILLGEALLAASMPLLIWFAVGVVVYVPAAEMPGLVKRFGEAICAEMDSEGEGGRGARARPQKSDIWSATHLANCIFCLPDSLPGSLPDSLPNRPFSPEESTRETSRVYTIS
jgi:protein-S-isoprenylcysteine O-methyltransferase Ste14